MDGRKLKPIGSCHICGEGFPAGSPDKFCEACKRARQRARAKARIEADPERERAMRAARYDPARQSEYDRRSREKHHAERLAKERADRDARREYHREKSRRYYARNRDLVLQRARQVHAEARREAVRRWRAKDPDWARALDREWSRANPEKVRAKAAARRALKAGADGSHTIEQWLALCEDFGGCCAYCGQDKPLTRDHVVPLIRGGSHDIANIVPACLSCNASKGARCAEEFVQAMAQAA